MLDHPEQQISGDKAQGSTVAAEVDDAVVGAAFGGPEVRPLNSLLYSDKSLENRQSNVTLHC